MCERHTHTHNGAEETKVECHTVPLAIADMFTTLHNTGLASDRISNIPFLIQILPEEPRILWVSFSSVWVRSHLQNSSLKKISIKSRKKKTTQVLSAKGLKYKMICCIQIKQKILTVTKTGGFTHC